MTKSIYIMSTAPHAGKTAVCIGLFLKFKEEGKEPGYFKPIGDPFSDVKITKADKDVNVIHKMLNRQYSREEICPIFVSQTNFLDEIPFEKVEGVKDLIKSSFGNLDSKTEIIIIEGNHDYNQFHTIGLSDITIAKLLGSDIILLSKVENDNDIDKIIVGVEKIRENELDLKGLILSNVTDLQNTKIKEKYADIFKDKKINFFGAIPKSRLLTAPTVGEVLEATRGTLLTDDLPIVKNILVEQFIIGAMQVNDALGYMRKSANLGVITGGDRTDIILTAVEVGVSLIILTGNLHPDPVSLAKAKDNEIPVILVSTDTYTTAHNIQNINVQIQQGEIDLCKEQIEKFIEWEKLIE